MLLSSGIRSSNCVEKNKKKAAAIGCSFLMLSSLCKNGRGV